MGGKPSPEVYKRYRQNPKGRASTAQYKATPEAKMVQHLRDTSPKCKLVHRLLMQRLRAR